MTKVSIRTDNLSKRYRIGARAVQAQSVTETVRRFAGAPFRYLHDTLRLPSEDEIIWALKDVSFEVKPGEVLGIIGRNGAGKSTLLKILSRITEPTYGRAEIHGRVGSLLEVGTGFHPDLTGRENIFMNGTILGMKRPEIERKFDAMVDFAGVEQFIDTPVKRYSSGMYVRLAFAVAAHIEPEILLVDEVLSVGDTAFQKKSLNKMHDVARGGRTVLLVSHNMNAIGRFATRCILLEKGRIIMDGPPEEVVQHYTAEGAVRKVRFEQAHNPSKPVNLRVAYVSDAAGVEKTEFRYDEDILVTIEYEVNLATANCCVFAGIHTLDGIVVFDSTNCDADAHAQDEKQPGYYRSSLRVPGKWLNCTSYNVVIGIYSTIYPGTAYDRLELTSISITDYGSFETSEADIRVGILKPLLCWNTSGPSSKPSTD